VRGAAIVVVSVARPPLNRPGSRVAGSYRCSSCCPRCRPEHLQRYLDEFVFRIARCPLRLMPLSAAARRDESQVRNGGGATGALALQSPKHPKSRAKSSDEPGFDSWRLRQIA
jgi:hypothetical protein